MKKLLILAAMFGFVACGGANKAEDKAEEAQAPEVEVVEEAVEEAVEAPAAAVEAVKPAAQPAVEAEKKVELGEVTSAAKPGVEFKTAQQVNEEFKEKVEKSANTVVLNTGKKVEAAVMETNNGAQLTAEKPEAKTLKQAGSLNAAK